MALISFDLDGVLQQNPFQSSRPDGVFGHIARELAAHIPGLPAEQAGAEALHQVLAESKRRMDGGRIVESFDWDDIVRTVGQSLGYAGQMDVAALTAKYAANAAICYLYPGTAECLQALTDAGHTLVTITNGFRIYQEPVLRQWGVLHYFKAMLSPESVGAAKPELGIFRAAEAYGAPQIHIGDTLPHDIAGAKRAGWIAIYVVQPGAPNYQPLPPHLADLEPWRRPAQAADWIRPRLAHDRRWHTYPPAELAECIPDAIVTSLAEIPPTVAHLLSV